MLSESTAIITSKFRFGPYFTDTAPRTVSPNISPSSWLIRSPDLDTRVTYTPTACHKCKASSALLRIVIVMTRLCSGPCFTDTGLRNNKRRYLSRNTVTK